MNRPRRKSYRHQPPWLLRNSIGLAEAVAPALAARWAADLFCRPRRRPDGPEERLLLEAATPERIHGLATHRWGDGPTVLLGHGWSGSAAQLAPLAHAVGSAGFCAVAFDAPAHGRSLGRRATLPDFSDAILSLAGHFGPLHAYVGHSFGGNAFARATQLGLRVDRAVILCSPAEVMPYGRLLQQALGLRDETMARMIEFLGRRTGLHWREATIEALSRDATTPLLLVHDRDDIDVPVEHAERWKAAWPGARLEFTEGFGHRRILREESVHRLVVDELRRGPL